MSLNIYTKREFVPEGLRVIDYNDIYFDLYTPLTLSEFEFEVLRKVDKAVPVAPDYFTGRTPEFGNLNRENLSTGSKTLLNIYSHPDFCFNVVECGDNALSMLSLLHKGNILWEKPFVLFDGEEDCDIVVNDTDHYTNFYDMLDVIEEEF